MPPTRETRRRPSAPARPPRGAPSAREELDRENEARREADTDQSASDLNQTVADSDQTVSDADQAASDADQALAERDQRASDRDQAAADRDLSRPGGGVATGEAHEASRAERVAVSRGRDSTAAIRSRTTAERLAAADERDEIARVRDLTAALRDHAAETREEAAIARERAAATRERLALEAGGAHDLIDPLTELRTLGASLRREAARERAAAAADRARAADDRRRAAADRRFADLDELTGVFRRGAGELALTHEIDRARRSGHPLVIAMIDVDELKLVNDTQGHAAGDALIRDVPVAITATLRSYDIVVRWGGDEFVCALSDMRREVASDRIAEIRAAFEALHPGASISAGLAELADDDTLESLIGRADAALYRSKPHRVA